MGKPLSEMTLEELWELFPIVLKEHNEAYKDWYAFESDRLVNLLGREKIQRINHIGSTAVKGLLAKPTVDILLEMKDDISVDSLTKLLNEDAWGLMSTENAPDLLTFNKGYKPDGFAEKVYHLHIRHFGDWNELYFKDYLMAHNEVAEAYGELKLKLFKDYEHNRDAYTQAKTDFVLEYSKKAKEEYAGRYVEDAGGIAPS